MDELITAIRTTPIIDNHAHPLLIPSAHGKYPLLAITTEAHGDAMKAATSSLSHIRAVKQLSKILGCLATWEAVVEAIKKEREKPDDAWMKQCLEGIETILVDDGLDGKDEVFDYSWHDRLTRSKCKRIVRIEKVAEEIIEGLLNEEGITLGLAVQHFGRRFTDAIRKAILDPEVVGFKSVICYRTGLDVSTCSNEEFFVEFKSLFSELEEAEAKTFKRIDRQIINWCLVNLTADLIRDSPRPKKPFQFHTGLGDNDITLTRSSPSQLQPFIRRYPTVPIVLLHASYPWTKEAGYLASVYQNVYADIGEVFPFLSKDGQEKVIREILELCPTEKVLWSTDGHWFPETYLLAVMQVREALEIVLPEYVREGAMTVLQAKKAVEDMFFKTSNDLYGLGLPLRPLSNTLTIRTQPNRADFQALTTFLEIHPTIKFIRVQYIDYTATSRLRVIPVKKALSVLQSNEHLSIGITKASLGLLQNDTLAPGMTASGEYKLQAIFSSIAPGPCKGYASVQGEFREYGGSEVELCPRSILRRTIEISQSKGLQFLLGFEIEIVFLSHPAPPNDTNTFIRLAGSEGHAWNSARALHDTKILGMLNEIYDNLSEAGIYLEQWHAEGATGQYEFILPPLVPLEAVDTLLHTREIITTIAASYAIRATLHPKPFASEPGTAAHAHISITSPIGDKTEVYEAFYAGILRHLPAILAFTYSNPTSYDRAADGCWAGGRWVAWGTQNRETALRKIEGSHWEIKCIDGLANIYLAMAAIISSGTQGVADKEPMVWGDCQKDPAELDIDEREKLGVTKMLPKNFNIAMTALEDDGVLRKLLGDNVVNRYLQVKRAEFANISAMGVHEKWKWIIERY
ncbi:hypothetical protein G7Y89_g4467 [Cudoniella acicularis]|uniref:GS catalytic domain-containing protein n=1 Tax=Cudoniella acicularis TaxID=354080 RepID=A0A8H4RRE7_9HELO|nr:hypothetical protein G7Y89_g4467 [Cudoniella acicularis]